MRRIRVNKTNLTLRNTFIANRFALGSEKELKNGKYTLFWYCPQSLDVSLNTFSLKTTYFPSFPRLS